MEIWNEARRKKIEKLIEEAWTCGSSLDLSDVQRGPKATGKAPPYYYFLAGLARLGSIKSAVEIGTNFGGSAVALTKGASNAKFRCVTADIEDFARLQLKNYSSIKHVIGDANSMGSIVPICNSFDGPIDLLFIDTKHDFDTTVRSFGIYFSFLSPRICVFDDITLNDEMKRFWELVQSRFGDRAINVVDVLPAVREHPKNPGFGIVVDDSWFSLMESSGRVGTSDS